MIKEIWKDIKGFEGRFKISNHGRLLSINGRHKGERVLEPHLGQSGYYIVMLRKKPLKRNVRIHTLVAEAFLTKPEGELICVNHLDGNKLNNHISNLEWTTYALNSKHAGETGLMPRGSDHHNSILNEQKVSEIRTLFSCYNNVRIGEMYGVNRKTISDIRLKKTWLSVS